MLHFFFRVTEGNEPMLRNGSFQLLSSFPCLFSRVFPRVFRPINKRRDLETHEKETHAQTHTHPRADPSNRPSTLLPFVPRFFIRLWPLSLSCDSFDVLRSRARSNEVNGEHGRPHLEAAVHPVASLPHLLHGGRAGEGGGSITASLTLSLVR